MGDAGDDSTQNSFNDSDPKKGLGERILAEVWRPARVKSYELPLLHCEVIKRAVFSHNREVMEYFKHRSEQLLVLI